MIEIGRRNAMDEIIRDLLDVLEAAEAAGAPLTDSPIRDSIHAVIYEGFVEPTAGYRVPADLLLDYTPQAAAQNAVVVQALERFVREANRVAESEGLESSEDRAAAFFDSEATSTSGDTSVGSFFD
jgi:hypothetical protein